MNYVFLWSCDDSLGLPSTFEKPAAICIRGRTREKAPRENEKEREGEEATEKAKITPQNIPPPEKECVSFKLWSGFTEISNIAGTRSKTGYRLCVCAVIKERPSSGDCGGIPRFSEEGTRSENMLLSGTWRVVRWRDWVASALVREPCTAFLIPRYVSLIGKRIK